MKYLAVLTFLFSLCGCSLFPVNTNRGSHTKEDKTIEQPLAEKEESSSKVTEPTPTADVEAQTEDAPKITPPQDTMVDESKPLTDNIASPVVEPVSESETVDVTLTKKSYIDEKYQNPNAGAAEAATVEESATYSGKSDGVDPDKALKWLKNGNKRFTSGSLRADGQSKKDIRRLSKSEKPHAIVFASSDSRVSPEIIFDEKLGEIYVIRNLGLTVDNSVLNSLDYAVGQLGSRLIVVLDRTYPGKGIDFTHADETMQKLVDQSTVLKAALDAKNVKVIAAVYNINTGKVEFGK